ncbi:ABC transporter ATP-binding protein [Aulosira sp. FACHB-615]|uniref:ABC transporter ATP-binding protein n=1 Tax=Aulosira sp. FACHB-615 TaxID=2692777 RepID=UPI001684487B|nr:ABC transporter ATP-binding protein [Aulosira sp. FACHB-615]MBD2487252.1 ABC transporter ATP-binding protein [Aulosira sp. FACHB-615]
MNLEVKHLCWSIEGKQILHDIHLQVSSGELVGLIGPNGSGKSSLLRCLYRVLKPDRGVITLNGKNIWHLSTREMAQTTAVVLQETSADFDFTVAEMVLMGRNPHQGLFDRETKKDHLIVLNALMQVGMNDFAERSFISLSGGEKQRVLIARAIAQQAQFLILDEPTNHLDIRYQLELLELVKGLGVTAIAALHDLNLAASYCDRIYVVHHGTIKAVGTPQDLLQPSLIREVFGVGSTVETNSKNGKLNISFFLDTK